MEEASESKPVAAKEKPKVTSRLFMPTANQKNSVFKPSEKSTEKKWATGATVPIRTPRDQFSSTHHSTNKKLQDVSSRLYAPTSASINGRATTATATATTDHATRQDRSPSPPAPEARTKSLKTSTTTSFAATSSAPLRTKSEASMRRPSIKTSSNSDPDDTTTHRPATASSARVPVLSHTVVLTQNNTLKARPSGYLPGTGVIQGSTLFKPTKAAMEGQYKKPAPSADDVNDKYKPVGTRKSVAPIVTKPVVSKPAASLTKTTKPTTPTAAAGPKKTGTFAVGALSDSKKAPVTKSEKVVAAAEIETTPSATSESKVAAETSIKLEKLSIESSEVATSSQPIESSSSSKQSTKQSTQQPESLENATTAEVVTKPASEKNTVPLPVIQTLQVHSLPPKSPGGGLGGVPDTGRSDAAYSIVDEDVGGVGEGGDNGDQREGDNSFSASDTIAEDGEETF